MTRALSLALLAAAACSHGAPAARGVSEGQSLEVIDAGVVVAGDAPRDAGAPDAGADEVLATLERTPCFGRCPVYTVTVYRDGRVAWDGRQNVGDQGARTAQLPPEKVQALVQAFRDAHFFELKHQQTGRYTTDMAGAVLTFRDGGQVRSIKDYHGDPGWPPELRKLEDTFDALVGTSRWVKPIE